MNEVEITDYSKRIVSGGREKKRVLSEGMFSVDRNWSAGINAV